jgi:hypothetical protein
MKKDSIYYSIPGAYINSDQINRSEADFAVNAPVAYLLSLNDRKTEQGNKFMENKFRL